MVKFVPVSPEEVPNIREGRRGRVSYPILKSFLETGVVLARLDRTGMQQSAQSLNMCLNQYIRNHDLPIEMFTRSGEIYLGRTDLDDDGNILERPMPRDGSLPKALLPEPEDYNEDDVKPVNLEEALSRFETEVGQTTK